MAEIREILDKLNYYTEAPKRTIAEYTEKTGKGAVGIFAPYAPEEIVHAAGLLPVGLWGARIALNKARISMPTFACSIMQSIKELEVCGHYDQLIAVICNSLCDTLKAMGQKWTKGDTIPLIHFTHAQHRDLPAACTYLVKEYGFIKERLEKLIGYEITEEELLKSIDIYDEHRAVMREFACVAAQYPDIIDIRKRHLVFKSAFFMRKEEHTVLVKELIAALKEQPVKPWEGKRFVFSGIMVEPDPVFDVFNDLGIAVAADDLAQEGRQYRTDNGKEGDALTRLAAQWINFVGCLAFDPKKPRIQMLADMVKESKADGLIVAMMKFCDPEEFDYPLIKRKMEEENIPLIQIEIDQQIETTEQLRTRLQSFVEMLDAKE